MAIHFATAEVGSFAEIEGTSGSPTVTSSSPIHGTYSYRTTGTSSFHFRYRSSSGSGWQTGHNQAAVSFWFKFANFGTNEATFFSVGSGSTSGRTVGVNCNSSGGILPAMASYSGSSYTISQNVVYRIKLIARNNSTSSVTLYSEDGTELATWPGTGFTNNAAYITAGHYDGTTTNKDVMFDDIWYDTDLTNPPPSIVGTIAVPTADGTYTHWTASAGDRWACVDEVPISTTDYVVSGTTAGDRYYSAAHATAAALGITGPIKGVKGWASLSENSSTTTLGRMGWVVGGGSPSFNDPTEDIGSTVQKVFELFITGSGSWSHSTFNTAEVCVHRDSGDTSSIRCSAMYLIVASEPVAPADLTLGIIPGLSGATLAVKTRPLLSLATVPGLSTATSTLSAAALLAMLADGESTAATTVKTAATLSLAAAAGLSDAVMTVIANAVLALGTVDGLSSAAVLVQSPALLGLSDSDGLSSASIAALSTDSFSLSLSAAAGLSDATVALRSPALLGMAADGLSAAAAVVISPAVLTMLADGIASATAEVLAPAILALEAAGLSAASAVVISKALLDILSDGAGSATLAMQLPPFLDLAAADGTSTAALQITFVYRRASMGGAVLSLRPEFAGVIVTNVPNMGAGVTVRDKLDGTGIIVGS